MSDDHARVYCTCGDALIVTLPMKLGSFARTLRAWARDHKGPDHKLCDRETAEQTQGALL